MALEGTVWLWSKARPEECCCFYGMEQWREPAALWVFCSWPLRGILDVERIAAYQQLASLMRSDDLECWSFLQLEADEKDWADGCGCQVSGPLR